MDQATAGLNQETHFAVTWDEKTGQIRAYENGAQVAGMNLPTKMSDINDVNVWLGRSNWTGDENTQGEFEDFRIYNRVLSLQEVQASEAIGPDNSLGEPRAIHISMPGSVPLGQTITPTVIGDFASVSNVDLSGTACFTLESSNTGAVSVGGEGTLVAVGGGSATITARLSGFSDSAGVTVTLPPVITRQPCANSVCLDVPGVTPPPAGGSVVSAQDFNSNDGGCTVIDVNGPFEGPWTYNAGPGTWSSAGQNAELNRPPSTRLTCPALTLTQAGNVRISFNHRYSFEDGGGYWDGGALQVSVNGGAFITVPTLAFVQNGYNGAVRGDSQAELRGQGAFVSTSTGYSTPAFITSIADIGCLSAGDTVAVRFLAAFDTNTRNGDPAWEIDSVSVIEGAGNGQGAELGVWAAPGNPGDSISVQWQKSIGGGPFADISGANNGLLALAPLLPDNGNCYRAIVTTSSGGSVTSTVACLTVIQPNTAPSFICGSNVTVLEDPGPQSITWAVGIVPHSFPPGVPIVFGSDFTSLPAGSQVFGSAAVSGGVLHLTDAANDQSGAWLSPASASKLVSYHISFKALVGGGTCCGDPTTGNPTATADGFSVNVAANLPNGTYANPAEEGEGSGLSICFDTWDNGNSEAPAIDVKFGGVTVASVHTQVAQSPNSVLDVFKDVSIDVSATGVLNVTYDGTNVFTNLQLPGYTPQTGLRFGIGARTGGANENHWIDDLSLTALAADDSLAEASQTVSFLVSNNNPGLFSQQPAVSPNGTLTYTPTPNACGIATVIVVAKDNGGTSALCGGNDTSAPCTFTINVNCVNDCPTANGQMVSAQSGVPLPITLTGSDPEGDALTAAVAFNPAHGTLSVISGVLNYTANAGYVGPDSFTFTVSDGQCTSAPATVAIIVTSPNHCPTATPQTLSAQPGVPTPIALGGSDADGDALTAAVASNPAHGTLSIISGVLNYTGNAGYAGPDSFTFTVSDGQCTSAPATVSISVNTPPTARIVASPLANFLPYLPNLVLIAANGSNACVTLDGSTSSDSETPANALNYAWSFQGSPTNFATGVRATNCVELGTYTYSLAVTDPQGATGTATLTIDVLTPCEAEGAIILIIQNSALPRNTKKSLVASVKAACAAYEKDGANSGANQLQAFQNKVRTHVRPVDLALAYQLEAAAQVIIDALEGL